MLWPVAQCAVCRRRDPVELCQLAGDGSILVLAAGTRAGHTFLSPPPSASSPPPSAASSPPPSSQASSSAFLTASHSSSLPANTHPSIFYPTSVRSPPRPHLTSTALSPDPQHDHHHHTRLGVCSTLVTCHHAADILHLTAADCAGCCCEGGRAAVLQSTRA